MRRDTAFGTWARGKGLDRWVITACLGGWLVGTVARATDFTVTGGATQALSTNLGGADTLTKQGAGTLQVTVDQTFTGDITLGDGTLILYGNAAAPTTVNGGLLMLGGTTGQPITLNAGTLRIGAQRSIPFTTASNSRSWIGYGSTNAGFNFGTGATFYTQSRATNQSQPQDIVNAGLPDNGLVTSLVDPSLAFQMNVNSAVSGSRVDSEAGSNTRFISIPAASQAKYVVVQTLLGHSTTAATTMSFLGYARYSDAATTNVYVGVTGGVPQFTAATGTPAVSVGRVNRDDNTFSTTPTALYQHTFETDPEKTMVQMGVVRSGTNSNQGGYFALSGLAVNDASTAFTSDITVAGNATLDLSGAAISGGTATLTGQALNLSGGTLTLTRSLGAARDYAATFTGGAVSATTSLAVNSPGSLAISGPLTGSGSLTKTGDGVLTLSGNNSFGSGTFTLGSGTTNVGYIRAANDNAFGGHSTVALASDQGGISGIQLEGGVAIPQNLRTEGRQNPTTSGYALRNLSGDNAWNGSITVVDSGGGYGFLADAGTLTLAGTVSSTQTAVPTRRGLEFTGAGNFVISGNMVPGGANLGQDLNVIKGGPGRLTLSGSNSYGGTTTVSSGVLLIQSASALGATSIGTTVADGAALEITGDILTAAEPLTISGTGIATGGALRNVSGTNTFSGPITLAAASRINSDAGQLTLSAASLPLAFDLTVGGAGDTVIQSAVSGAGAFAKGGTGTVTLAGANSFGSGTLTLGSGSLNVGYLRLTNDAALGNHTTLFLQSAQTGGVSGVQLEGGVTISQALETRGRGNAGTSGYAIRSISGDNAWTGPIAITAGGGGYGFVSDAGTLTLGGTLSSTVTGTSGSRGVLFGGAGDIVVNGNMLRTGTDSAGDLNVAMNGTGRLVLSGTNTYTGPTSVNTGTLLINGNSSAATGAVSVALAGTLGGTGTVGGATTINGTHSPGASPGLQAFTGGLAYASTGTLVWELSANTDLSADRGVLYDGIDVTGGSLDIAAGSIINLVFNAPLADSTPSVVNWADSFWNSDRSWTVISFSSSSPATSTGLFTLGTVGPDSLGQSLTSVAGREAASFTVLRAGDDVVLQYSAVPEPGTLAFGGLGAALGFWALRRRAGRR
jgi:autotransporter-associated beta strand protein